MESPLCSFPVLSLAISSLGTRKVGGVGKSFEPCHGSQATGGRGVRGTGQGDNLGQYSQATGELCNKKRSRQNHEEDLQWVALPDQPTLRQSEQNVEAARCVNMCQLKSGVHTCKYKLMTGTVAVLNSVKALSGSVPPCPLLPTSSPLRRSEGMAHRTRLTPEISSYRYSVCA